MIYIITKLAKKNILKLTDEKFVNLEYYLHFKKKLNLKNPQTFNEKLQWLKLYDRKDIYTTMVDKYEVKNYISKLIGEEYIIPTLGIYNKWEEIDFDSLPNQFVIKCTHDSGGLAICTDKKSFDFKKAEAKIKKSLKNNYYYSNREWPYKNVKPRIIIEKYIGENLNDYKIFCFSGISKYILVCSNRNGKYKNTNFYDTKWNLMPFTRKEHSNNPNGISKPENLKDMLKIAEKLSKNIPFVRVDLYDINNKIYFGELTFFPSAGFEGFSPEEWDKKLGDMIELPKIKK